MVSLVRYYIKTSIAFLFLGLLLGGYMIYVREILGTYPNMLLVSAHAHLILIGFIMMMIMGIALWMFPKPRKGDERYRPGVAHFVYWAMAVSTGGRSLGEVLKASFPSPALDRLIVICAAVQIAAMIVFFLNIWVRVRGVRPRTGANRRDAL